MIYPNQVLCKFSVIIIFISIRPLVIFIFFAKRVPIKVEYDKTFKEAWGDESLFAIRGILACVQNIYRWSSWKVKLEFKLIREIEFNPSKSFELKNYRPDDMEKCAYAPL